MVAIHPDKTAFRAVDACGGVYSSAEEASGYAQGHHDALTAAGEAVRSVDDLTADLFKIAANLASHYEGVEADELFRTLPNHVAWAVVNAREAVTKAVSQ